MRPTAPPQAAGRMMAARKADADAEARARTGGITRPTGPRAPNRALPTAPG